MRSSIASQIYVGDSTQLTAGDPVIRAFRNTGGNEPPLRTFPRPTVGLNRDTGLAFLPGTNPRLRLVYAANGIGGAVLAIDSQTGAGVPGQSVFGSQTQLDLPRTPCLDEAGNLYVINQNSITEYPPGSGGNATPARIIQGFLTELDRGLFQFLSLGLDGDLIVTQRRTREGDAPRVLVFAAGASGNVRPARVISGSFTRLDARALTRAAVARVGTPSGPRPRIFVATETELLAFDYLDSGNVPPSR